MNIVAEMLTQREPKFGKLDDKIKDILDYGLELSLKPDPQRLSAYRLHLSRSPDLEVSASVEHHALLSSPLLDLIGVLQVQYDQLEEITGVEE